MTTAGIPTGNNETGYSNPAFDDLFVQQGKELDKDKRKEMVWELQKIAFDAFRHKNAVMVIVKPQPFDEGHMSIMTINGKPLAFKQVQDEIMVFDEDEKMFDEEDAVWLEERHYNRFRDDYGMQIPNVKSVKYGLRLAGYLTEEDKDLWQKAQ